MEISTALFILGIAIYGLWVHISELHAKVDILMQSNDVDWERYFTEELVAELKRGKTAKATMLLRQQTGLSAKTCQAIVSKYQSGLA